MSLKCLSRVNNGYFFRLNSNYLSSFEVSRQCGLEMKLSEERVIKRLELWDCLQIPFDKIQYVSFKTVFWLLLHHINNSLLHTLDHFVVVFVNKLGKTFYLLEHLSRKDSILDVNVRASFVVILLVPDLLKNLLILCLLLHFFKLKLCLR